MQRFWIKNPLSILFANVLVLSLSGCQGSYDPQQNPLLTETVPEAASGVWGLEKFLLQANFQKYSWAQDGTGVSPLYACWQNPRHFETREQPGTQNCERWMRAIADQAHQGQSNLKSLKIEDLQGAQVSKRLGPALFSLSMYGHL